MREVRAEKFGTPARQVGCGVWCGRSWFGPVAGGLHPHAEVALLSRLDQDESQEGPLPRIRGAREAGRRVPRIVARVRFHKILLSFDCAPNIPPLMYSGCIRVGSPQL